MKSKPKRSNQILKYKKRRRNKIDRGILKDLTASAEIWSTEMILWKPTEYEQKFKFPVKDGLKSMIKLFLVRNYNSLDKENKTFIIKELKILNTVHFLRVFLSLAVDLDCLGTIENPHLMHCCKNQWARFLFEVISFIKNQLYLPQSLTLKIISERNCKNINAQYI